MAQLPNIISSTVDNVDNFPHQYFNLELKSTRNFKHLNQDIAQEFSYTAVLKNSYPNSYLQNILPQLHNLFESLLDEIKTVYRDFDYVRIFIQHLGLTSCNIIIPPTFLKEISAQQIMQEIARVIRSNNAIPADKKLQINVAAIRNVTGTKYYKMTNVWKDLIKKQCIICIQNTDILCLPRAIAVAIAYVKSKAHPKDHNLKRIYETIRKSDGGRVVQRGGFSLQKRTALLYLKKTQLPQRVGILADIPHYEKALQVGINVFSAAFANKKIYPASKSYNTQITLYHTDNITGIGHGHFSVITKVNALLNCSYYCDECDMGYKVQNQHHCRITCNLCTRTNCLKDIVHPCTVCHAPCRSKECLQIHQEKNKCASLQFCPRCHIRLKSRTLTQHQCGESYCLNCQVFYLPEETEHRCYMKATESREDSKRYIFYDFESMQEGESDHIPNLVIAHSICSTCQNNTQVQPQSKCSRCGSRCMQCDALNRDGEFKHPPCINCGHREMIFAGMNTVQNFCQWLIHPQHKNTLVIAHNAKAYDAYFIYTYLIRTAIKPSIIFQGTKIMYCHIKTLNIKLLDSVNFLPMPLASLPNSFGLDEMKKGFFPYLYNTFHQKEPYLSHLPDMSFYDPDNMYQNRRQEFHTWYAENEQNSFDLYTELIEYCRSDVNILLNACWKFRQLILDVTNQKVDPFTYVTIASVCMGIFRTCFLPEKWKVLLTENAQDGCNHEYQCTCQYTEARKQNANAPLEILENSIWNDSKDQFIVKKLFVSSPIALLPPSGYARRDRFSKQSLEWLTIFQMTFPEPIDIQSAQSSCGEKKVFYFYRNQQHFFRLDGYFQDSYQRHHALEFNGCYFHGCPVCFPDNRETTLVGNKSLALRFQETQFKANMLASLGYILHSIWACVFEQKKNTIWLHYANSLKIREPLNIRDCYFGGRTNALVLDKTFTSEEKGGYVDFCSLYPYALKHFPYPTGHPQRITSNFLPLIITACKEKPCSQFHALCPGQHTSLPYVGVIKAKLLPPPHLYHPIIPTRCNGKLMFPLCYHCAVTENRYPCQCSDSERAIEDTWCTPEVNAALTAGYKIQNIYEILHWDEQTSTLFDDYINTFLRFKAQASGFPENVKTMQEKQDFIQRYQQHEGITLDIKQIEKNPGLRSIAKLALNSFYGKFGQRTNMKKYTFIRYPQELYNMLSDVTKELSDFHILSENMMIVEYMQAKEFQNVDPKTNVLISAFCSSYARLHLWKMMNFLDRRVLYHDTDSLIYTYTPQQVHPPTGSFLGELTNELECKSVGCSGCSQGHWIEDYVSCGPKNYAYRLNSGETTCKVRGFSLNYTSSQIIHFDSMRQALYHWYHDSPNNTADDMMTVMTQILRDKIKARIYTKKVPKRYGVVYNKRRVLNDYTTQPFGYK